MTDTLHPSSQPSAVHCDPAVDGMVIRLVGEIDISAWPRLDEAYAQVIAADPGPVTVDLSAATFVDSTTLGFLARLHQHVTDSGHEFLLDSPNRIVSRAIEVCGLDQVLKVRPTDQA